MTTGTTDISVDPLFVDAATGDYRLSGGSPLINAGTIVAAVTTDFEGEPRPTGSSHDIGFDEVVRYEFLPLVVRAFSG